ncbi:PadR family transcriptional regulator [Bacillus carboniphilus]|uniref:PadR family transcriptional regulator n=1 Tax=Bacillus carboniphilus TaxID=86663 RepID=A0ABY9JXP6_9BACI|nr:PadR family transcriptional regulator [Bacillus carboniphilus]WLR43215.1 PadR family transcriptional regulator [Bacillus carboniphilus]
MKDKLTTDNASGTMSVRYINKKGDEVSVKHILLGVLSWAPNSGYGIKSEVEYKGRELGWGRVSFGSIYPQLKKLVDEGLIQTLHTGNEGRKTKIYELTSKGWTELTHWLNQPPSPPEMRDELFIKMSFWDTGSPEDRKSLIHHLRSRLKENREMLSHFEEWTKNDLSAIGEIGGISMDFIIARIRFDIEWYEKMVAVMNQQSNIPRQDPDQLFEKAKARRIEALRKDLVDED